MGCPLLAPLALAVAEPACPLLSAAMTPAAPHRRKRQQHRHHLCYQQQLKFQQQCHCSTRRASWIHGHAGAECTFASPAASPSPFMAAARPAYTYTA